jgi:hypothetical protein
MKYFRFNLILIVIISIISGCFGKSQKIVAQNDTDKINPKVVAIMPVENQGADAKAAQLLRFRLLEELYFKGYSKIPLEKIDKSLESLHLTQDKKNNSPVIRQTLKDTFGADAGMYCILKEDNKPKIFYAPMEIYVSCELQSTQTGEVIWKAQAESVRRNFDFTNKGLEKKSHEEFEAVIDEVVSKIIKTLPDGPTLRI